MNRNDIARLLMKYAKIDAKAGGLALPDIDGLADEMKKDEVNEALESCGIDCIFKSAP